MLVYHYSRFTKEYVSQSEADSDPAETEKQGHFVPLVPAYATLLEVPSYSSYDEIPVFETNKWVVKDDFRKNFKKVDNNLDVFDITTIGEQEGYIVVTNELAEDIKADKSWYKIVDGEIVKKTQKEHDDEEAEKERQRIANLTCTKREFILMLEALQLNYFTQIKPAIEANRQAALEWELCERLLRSNELIDQLADGFGISSEQIDALFKYANGEITEEEFRSV